MAPRNPPPPWENSLPPVGARPRSSGLWGTGRERKGGRVVGRLRRGTGPEAGWLRGGAGGLPGGLRRGGAAGASSAGELGVEGGVVEEVGDGEGRGRLRDSFTLPRRGRGTLGPPGGWWR